MTSQEHVSLSDLPRIGKDAFDTASALYPASVTAQSAYIAMNLRRFNNLESIGLSFIRKPALVEKSVEMAINAHRNNSYAPQINSPEDEAMFTSMFKKVALQVFVFADAATSFIDPTLQETLAYFKNKVLPGREALMKKTEPELREALIQLGLEKGLVAKSPNPIQVCELQYLAYLHAHVWGKDLVGLRVYVERRQELDAWLSKIPEMQNTP